MSDISGKQVTNTADIILQEQLALLTKDWSPSKSTIVGYWAECDSLVYAHGKTIYVLGLVVKQLSTPLIIDELLGDIEEFENKDGCLYVHTKDADKSHLYKFVENPRSVRGFALELVK